MNIGDLALLEERVLEVVNSFDEVRNAVIFGPFDVLFEVCGQRGIQTLQV